MNKKLTQEDMERLGIKKPNLFIIGAPKCGTTALRTYLSTHPDIFFYTEGEPTFFCKDFTDQRRIYFTEKEYLTSCFRGASGYNEVGEKSVWYLFSKEAVPNILIFSPHSKFIVMLRNPVEMFHSLYYQFCFELRENAKTPEKAWQLQEVRRKGEKTPKHSPDPKNLQYGKICKLGEQMERLYSSVPKERVLVIFFDDFKKDTRTVYRNTLSFLNLADDGRNNFEIHNKRKTRISRNLYKIVQAIGNIKLKLCINKNFGFLNYLQSKNKKQIKPPPLDEEFREELIHYFREDIKKLSDLTGRDLSNWNRVCNNKTIKN